MWASKDLALRGRPKSNQPKLQNPDCRTLTLKQPTRTQSGCLHWACRYVEATKRFAREFIWSCPFVPAPLIKLEAAQCNLLKALDSSEETLIFPPWLSQKSEPSRNLYDKTSVFAY